MNRFSVVLICSLILCFFRGCAEDDSSSSIDLEGHTYTGVIPCADCEGIDYRLMLLNDNRFKTLSMYIGETNRRFVDRGSWVIENDSLLIVNTESGDRSRFKIGENKLRLLSKEGKVVEGVLADRYLLLRADSPVVDERWEDWREEGIDFHAAGNEPSWSLDIDFDKMIRFKTLGVDSITTPVPQMQQDSAGKARLWNAETESGSLQFKLHPIGCMDDMSGEVFNYRVEVAQADTSYSGCGSFINPKYKLNDFWALHTLNGATVAETDTMRQLPALQFDVANEKMYGNSGCNQLQGNVALEDSSISFSKVVSTKMACRGTIETRFMEALQQVETYDIANAELMLIGAQDTLMTFRRAE